MSRFARERRVFFFEEPVWEGNSDPFLRSTLDPESGVEIATPIIPIGYRPELVTATQRQLLDELLERRDVTDPVLWYYTPMAREFSRQLSASAMVYDCMDELSAFAGAPAAMRNNEAELFQHADLVFTGGASLFAAKRLQHPHVHCFPSSVDVRHFMQARSVQQEPADQAIIPHPRLGYAGVIDERMDLNLLREVAAGRPDWHFVMLGPVVKIDPGTLPQAPNLHYLGMKPYAELPGYFSGWRVGLLPFALNEATRFISPTKTPEYLAAGLRVLSTPIRDVVSPYGDSGLAAIGKDPSDFLRLADELLSSPVSDDFRQQSDAFLSKSSWDRTWSEMSRLIAEATRKPGAGQVGTAEVEGEEDAQCMTI